MALTAHFHDLQEHGQSAHRNRNIGVIDTATSLRALAEEMRTLLPLVTGVSDTKIDIDGVDDARFPFIPEHLRFILLELCKNAVYAAVRNGIAARISITLADAQRTVGVRVSDQCKGFIRNIHACYANIARSRSRRHTAACFNLHRLGRPVCHSTTTLS